jgi:hypothetical protein
LESYVALQDAIKDYTARLEAMKDQLLSELKNGVPVEAGTLKANIKITERRNVAWKQIIERELGSAFAMRVLAATKPQQYENLEVKA